MDMLLNWIWQGTLVAAAATVAMKILRIQDAAWRYRFWWASMGVVLMLPAMAAAVWTPVPMPSAGADVAVAETPYLPDVYVSDILFVVAIVLAAWASWIAVQLIRICLALVGLRRARRRCAAFPADREARLEHWMAIRRSTDLPLVVSSEVQSAAVIGFRRPAIAVSPRLLDRLTDEELDRVVVHEWAHVDRGDHVFHAAQILLRVLAGCLPAVWWIGRQLDAERESACDEMTVRVTGSPKAYAACLARLAEISSAPPASLPVPAAISSSHVRQRIVHVLGISGQGGGRRPRIKAGVAAAGVMLIGFEAASSALVLPAVERAAMLVSAMPEPELRTHSAGPPNIRVTAAADRPSRPRPLNTERAASAPVVAVMEPEASPPAPPQAPASVAETPSIEHLPLAATLNTDTMPALQVITAPVPPQTPQTVTPWGAARNSGVAVGRASQKAAESTAGFFSRFGKKIAGSF